jgi:hypothetical protein
MNQIDWGQVTPEAADSDRDFYYVYNHDISSIEKAERTVRFIVGRLNYYNLHLPQNPNHIIKIDIRGQHQ